jgi:hypothetical protein
LSGDGALMALVFISFIHEDIEVARGVQRLLAEALSLGDEVFLSSDKTQVYAGEEWLSKIRTSLSAARVVVVLLSEKSVARPWINFEAGAAWLSSEKVVIPCCYGHLSKEKLPHPYSSLQAVDLPMDAEYLVMSVHHHLGGTGTAEKRPRPTLKALSVQAEPRTPDGPYERFDSVFSDYWYQEQLGNEIEEALERSKSSEPGEDT